MIKDRSQKPTVIKIRCVFEFSTTGTIFRVAYGTYHVSTMLRRRDWGGGGAMEGVPGYWERRQGERGVLIVSSTSTGQSRVRVCTGLEEESHSLQSRLNRSVADSGGRWGDAAGAGPDRSKPVSL